MTSCFVYGVDTHLLMNGADMEPSINRVNSVLTSQEVGPGVPYTCYIPERAGSATHGVFTSHPYEDSHGDMIVDYILEGESTTRTGALSSFGITSSPHGGQGEHVTVEREE